MISLEELRVALLDSVRNCPNPHSVAELIGDAERKLKASHIGEQSRRAFWDAVDHDLVVVIQEASVILERKRALTLRSTIDMARSVLNSYRRDVPDRKKSSSP